MVSKSCIRFHKGRDELIKLFGSKCVRCGSKNNLEFHHLIKTFKPSKGGFSGGLLRLADWKRNLDKIQLLCKRCHCLAHAEKSKLLQRKL